MSQQLPDARTVSASADPDGESIKLHIEPSHGGLPTIRGISRDDLCCIISVAIDAGVLSATDEGGGFFLIQVGKPSLCIELRPRTLRLTSGVWEDHEVYVQDIPPRVVEPAEMREALSYLHGFFDAEGLPYSIKNYNEHLPSFMHSLNGVAYLVCVRDALPNDCGLKDAAFAIAEERYEITHKEGGS